ncbi:MAG: ATP-binding protein [Planctomycetota bacterium]|nr:ATP-binding protein [Planctomycetota bacterium]
MSEEDDAYVTICIPATANFMRVVREAIQQAAEDFGFSEDDGAQIVMAVDEASTNVVQHGQSIEPDNQLKLYLRVVFSKDRLIVELIDKAKRFSPLDDRGPTVKEFLASGKTHGIGLYVMHTLVDEIEHDYTEGEGNRLRLVKVLPLKPMS